MAELGDLLELFIPCDHNNLVDKCAVFKGKNGPAEHWHGAELHEDLVAAHALGTAGRDYHRRANRRLFLFLQNRAEIHFPASF